MFQNILVVVQMVLNPCLSVRVNIIIELVGCIFAKMNSVYSVQIERKQQLHHIPQHSQKLPTAYVWHSGDSHLERTQRDDVSENNVETGPPMTSLRYTKLEILSQESKNGFHQAPCICWQRTLYPQGSHCVCVECLGWQRTLCIYKDHNLLCLHRVPWLAKDTIYKDFTVSGLRALADKGHCISTRTILCLHWVPSLTKDTVYLQGLYFVWIECLALFI